MSIFKISRAYLSNKNKTGLAKLHSYISIFGIMFGIAALIVVNSAMKGFSSHLIEKLSKGEEHVEFVIDDNISKSSKMAIFDILKNDSNIDNYLELKILNNEYRSEIYDDYPAFLYVLSNNYLKLKDDTVYFPSNYKDFLKQKLKKDNLAIDNLYVPIQILNIDNTNRHIYVGYNKYENSDFVRNGVIDQSILKVDFIDSHAKGMIISQKTFDENFFVPNLLSNKTIVKIKLKDPLISMELANIIKKFNEVLEVEHWLEYKEDFLNSLKLEQLLIKIVLFFIVLVSCFNIVSTMTLIITEKKQDIYLLKTIGYSNKQVLSIFLFTGLFYGLLGLVSGTLLGLLITLNLAEVFYVFEWLFNIKMLPIGMENFPYSLLKNDLIVINGFTILIVMIASLVPALNTLKMNPAQGLKDE